MTEAEFQEWLRQLAKLTGWMYYHTHRSRFSPAGFPDAILLKDGWGIAAELKVGKNAATEEQVVWIAEFSRVPGFRGFVWHPKDRPFIEEHLSGKQPARYDDGWEG